MILDLFAGPGGWDEGLRKLGVTNVVGIEWDMDACRTTTAAGHVRLRADISKYPTAPFIGRTTGLIASPPCPAFSTAGKGEGREVLPALLEAISERRWDALRDRDSIVWLSLEVGRWVEELEPAWVVCEQVPQALPLWEAYVDVLQAMGYHAACRVLMAADYGVPQTRQRAFLIASREHPVQWPEPTHYGDRRRRGQPDLFGQPWVTCADALGWTGSIDRRTNSKDGRGGMVPTVRVPTDQPAPTVTGQAVGQWKVYPQWTFERPAPTIIGTSKIAAPGHRCMSDSCCGRGRTSHFDADAIDVEPWQAGVLQSFPPDYPWQGTKTSRGQQVGNAVPPVLAAAVVRQFIKAAKRQEVA